MAQYTALVAGGNVAGMVANDLIDSAISFSYRCFTLHEFTVDEEFKNALDTFIEQDTEQDRDEQDNYRE